MKRTKISELLKTKPENQEVVVKGWVRTKRESGKGFGFLALNDGSTIHNIQVVLDENTAGWDQIGKANTGASVSVNGILVESPGKGQAVEIQGKALEVLGEAPDFPLQKKKMTVEYLRHEQGHLRVRTNTFGCVFRIRHSAAYAIHKFFNDKGFYYVHTPIITGADCEGAGEMFAVTTLNIQNPPKDPQGNVDFNEDFFGKPTHLTVSGQLNGELFALGLGEIYTFGPTFRAENSNTARHLAEFWMVEPEMAFYEAEDNQDLAEEFIQSVIRYVMEHNADDLEFLNKMYDKELLEKLDFVVNNKFERLPYTKAIEILENSGKKFEFPVKWGVDLQAEHERYLVEQHFKKPVIVIDYPKEIKAFYMKLNEDGKTVRAMDVLFPGIGEIIGGSQREEDYDKLLGRIRELGLPEENYWWYLDTRKFGTAPHSGFGLGFERLLLFLTGMGNIRDVIPFPRTPKNAEY